MPFSVPQSGRVDSAPDADRGLFATFFEKLLIIVANLRRIKIRTRLIISLSCLSLIPLLIISFFSYYKYTNSINSKLSKSSLQLLEQLDRNISTEIRKCEHICDLLSIDDLIQTSLINYHQLDYPARRQMILNIRDLLAEKGLLLWYIQNIYIFTRDGEPLYEFGYDSFDNKSIEEFIKGVDKNSPLDYWTFARTRRGVDSLVLCRNINQESDTSVRLGYMFVVIDDREFSNWTYTYVDMGKGANIFILSENNIILSGSDYNIPFGRPYPDQMLFSNMIASQRKGQSIFTMRLSGEKNLIIYTYNSRTKWYLVSTIPYSYIRSETSSITGGLILLSFGCLLFSIIISIIITLSIDMPIRKMVSTIKNVTNGNLEIRIADQFDDEMGYLSKKFDTMIVQLKELNIQSEEDQKRKREFELKMLQAQINPHFLFNTLNSLKWTAMMSRVTTVSDGLGALADLLRNTIINKDELITLAEELKNIENYLLIQRIRYGDSFKVIFEIDADLKDNMILKFLLQPIVENSIIHGLHESKKLVTITIKCQRNTENMQIIIQDDGKGFDVNEISTTDQLNRQKDREKLSKIGIDNVKERILLHFGDKYGLSIESHPGYGTTVRMNLPLITKTGDNAC